MAKPFPSAALKPRAYSFTPANTLRSGPLSDGGIRQEVMTDAGFWTARYENVPASGDRVLVLRAFLLEAMAMRSTYAVGPIDCFHSPLAGKAAAEDQHLHWQDRAGNLLTWGGGELWASSRSFALVEGSVVAGAMSLVADVDQNFEVKPGQYFGISGWLYQIRATRLQDLTENHWIIDFWPKLRTAAAHNTILELAHPACPMRLTNAPEALMDLGRLTTVTLEFEEAVWEAA